MNLQLIENLVRRLAFYGGIIVMLFAFLEGVVQVLGHSLVAYHYAPSRLLEIGAALLVLAIACLLRQIRDALRAR